MSFKFTLLAALVFGCCLVSLASAGCEGCSFGPTGGTPSGGWGIPDYSNHPYWGMSADDIKNARSSASYTVITREWPPKLIMPTSDTDKFGSLGGYKSKLSDSQSKSLSESLTPTSENKQTLLRFRKTSYYAG